MLSDTPLLGMPIKVLPVNQATAVPEQVLPPPVPLAVPPLLPMPVGILQTATLINTVRAAPPPPSPFNNKPPEQTNQQTPEEMARTLYVGNISESVTPESLTTMFGQCGTVTFLRLTGGNNGRRRARTRAQWQHRSQR